MNIIRRSVLFQLIIVLLIVSQECESVVAPNCVGSSVKCLPPDCRCSSTDIPGGLSKNNTPQFVMLTFDDAVTVSNINYYDHLKNRFNRNGCPLSMTFFVSHDYTDYSLVNRLYREGHEIALHSITHNVSTEYWQTISQAELTGEFSGERQIISRFGNISESEIKGIRLPFLQMSGDISFEMMNRENFTYDCSWPSRQFTSPGLWPYTLDTQSTQDCVIGPCPNEQWNGTWVVPMLAWTDRKGFPCSMVDTCLDLPLDVDGLVNFMIENFNQSYHSNKAPFGYYLHAAWFDVHENHFQAYVKFIDYLQTLNDVFIISISDVIEWIRHPKSLSEMAAISNRTCRMPDNAYENCPQKKVCRLQNEVNGQERFMTVCSNHCPKVHPWIGNPLGE